MTALGAGPSVVALDADYPATSELIIATGLDAGQPAVDVVIAGPEERTNRGNVNQFPSRPQATQMAADVAAGPWRDEYSRGRRSRRRPVNRRWPQVGSDGGGRNQRSKCEACEEGFLHDVPLGDEPLYSLAHLIKRTIVWRRQLAVTVIVRLTAHCS